MLIWRKTKTGLTCKSTPLAPLVTCFSFTRMHLSAEKICWVTQSVFWVNSHVSCWAHLGMSSMARLWRVKCAWFSECLFESKSFDSYWLNPKPQRPSTPLDLRTCTCTKCFLIVSLLNIASSHSAKDRPNRSQWSVLQCFKPQCTLSSVCLLCLSSFSICLNLYPYYLSVSISFSIFCLSPS